MKRVDGKLKWTTVMIDTCMEGCRKNCTAELQGMNRIEYKTYIPNEVRKLSRGLVMYSVVLAFCCLKVHREQREREVINSIVFCYCSKLRRIVGCFSNFLYIHI